MDTPCFAITHIPKRYEALCKRADCAFSVVVQVDAVRDGIAVLEGSTFRSIHPTMTDGAVGCLLAHIAVWKHVQSLPCGFALVAEDDWIPPDGWKEHLVDIVSAAPEEADLIHLTRPSTTIWCDDRDAAFGRCVTVNKTYTLRECLPMYSTGCMLIRPSCASKLVGNLGTHMVPSDVFCWMSAATDRQLAEAFPAGSPLQKTFESYAHKMRSAPGFSGIRTWVVQRPRKFEKMVDGRYQTAQFGRTPILAKSTTESLQFNIRDAIATRPSCQEAASDFPARHAPTAFESGIVRPPECRDGLQGVDDIARSSSHVDHTNVGCFHTSS